MSVMKTYATYDMEFQLPSSGEGAGMEGGRVVCWGCSDPITELIQPHMLRIPTLQAKWGEGRANIEKIYTLSLKG